MVANVEEQPKKINFKEEISKTRVKQIVAEEEHLTSTDEEVQQLRAITNELLDRMEAARKDGNEEERRKFRNEVVVKNLRLVTQVLKKYGYFNQDKFQNGCIGLLKAADTFNSEKGVPFSNYAAFCIETEVRLAFRRVNRMFEGKKEGFLDSLDAGMGNGEDKEISKYEMVPDPYAEVELDAILEEAEIDTLFYDIIIPCIEEYGQRSKDINMTLWRQLEIQYFIELSMEGSQRQRLTFTEMAKQLGSVPQNVRTRHQKVVALIKERCRARGWYVAVSPNGVARIVKEDVRGEVFAIEKMRLKERNRNSKRRR